MNKNVKQPGPATDTPEAPVPVPNQPPNDFVHSAELARRLGIGVGTLRQWTKVGKLPFIQLRRKIVWHWPTVQQALLRAQRNNGGVL